MADPTNSLGKVALALVVLITVLIGIAAYECVEGEISDAEYSILAIQCSNTPELEKYVASALKDGEISNREYSGLQQRLAMIRGGIDKSILKSKAAKYNN